MREGEFVCSHSHGYAFACARLFAPLRVCVCVRMCVRVRVHVNSGSHTFANPRTPLNIRQYTTHASTPRMQYTYIHVCAY